MIEHFSDAPREPSLLDTAMRIETPEHLERLKLKLEEYRRRAEKRSGALVYNHPDVQLSELGSRLFTEPILDYVVTAATARDTTIDPIVITEVALAVGEATGYDVSRSVTIPFRFNEAAAVFEPDQGRLAIEATLADVHFSEAYVIIKAYANNEMHGVRGGTGLPELPTQE